MRMPSGRLAAPIASGLAILVAVLGPDPTGTRPSTSPPVSSRSWSRPRSVSRLVSAVAAGLVGGLVHRGGPHPRGGRDRRPVPGRASRRAEAPGPGWRSSTQTPGCGRIRLVMMSAAAAGLYADLVLTGLVRAKRSGVPMLGAVREELEEAKALTFGVLAAGPLVAFLAPGWICWPSRSGLLPMMLTNVAVRRYAANRATYRQTIATLSRLTDVAGYTPTGHAARVAERAVAIGRFMGLHADAVQDLEYAALLHDLGQKVGRRSPHPRRRHRARGTRTTSAGSPPRGPASCAGTGGARPGGRPHGAPDDARSATCASGARRCRCRAASSRSPTPSTTSPTAAPTTHSVGNLPSAADPPRPRVRVRPGGRRGPHPHHRGRSGA